MSNLVIVGGYAESNRLLKAVANEIDDKAKIVSWSDYRKIVRSSNNLPRLDSASVILAHSSGVLLLKHWQETNPMNVKKAILVSPVGHEQVKIGHGLGRFMRKNVLLVKLLFSGSAKRGSLARQQIFRLFMDGFFEILFHPITFVRLMFLVTKLSFDPLRLGKSVHVIHVDNDILSPTHTLPEGVSIPSDSDFGHDALVLDKSFMTKIAELV